MYNPNTRRVMETHDVVFMHRMFYQEKCDENSKSHPHIIVKVEKYAMVEVMPSETDKKTNIREE